MKCEKMVCSLCHFKISLTVFNQSYNCQTSHYLGRNRLPKPFLILPSLGANEFVAMLEGKTKRDLNFSRFNLVK